MYNLVSKFILTILILGFFMSQHIVNAQSSRVTQSEFGQLKDGRKITRYQLENEQGTKVSIIDLGAIITELYTKDKKGNFADIVLGFDNPQQYIDDSPYFGAVVGRYGNRIAKGKFDLNGKSYTLATNNGENHLHGGVVGFDKKLWQGNIENNQTVSFYLVSPDNDQGYPGELSIKVTYQLTNDDQLIIDYLANTSKKTIVNLTQHSYFNLAGHNKGSILDHQLLINAKKYTPVDNTLITTGELADVRHTPFDFSVLTPIGERINNQHQQLIYGKGYDHNWVLNDIKPENIALAAKVYEPTTGRVLVVHTDQPGIQFYAGNFLDGSFISKDNAKYQHRNGFCLETQHFPDSPNKSHFPSTTLDPNQTYKTRTIYSFDTQ